MKHFQEKIRAGTTTTKKYHKEGGMAIGSGWTVTSFQRVVLQTTTTTTKFSRCPITNLTRPLADYPLESKDYISNYPIGYIPYTVHSILKP